MMPFRNLCDNLDVLSSLVSINVSKLSTIVNGNMNLREYLDKKKITYGAFAEIVGVHEQTIKNIACGIRKPGLKLALRIEELTEGNVTPRNLIDNFENDLKTPSKRKSFKKKPK